MSFLGGGGYIGKGAGALYAMEMVRKLGEGGFKYFTGRLGLVNRMMRRTRPG